VKGDRAAVTVTVDVSPAVAFEVFTTEIDSWWRRGPKYRVSARVRAPGVLVLEPRVGGRLFEQYDGPDGPLAHEAGRVVAWEPPEHLAFEWRGANFAPGEVTLVDVRFVDLTAPPSGGAARRAQVPARDRGGKTEVRLVHTGFAALRPDHPVRHGEPPDVFIRTIGLWWGDLMTALREHAAERR
jgi:uncharacterized protein YndB with AHSA1/START domain